MWQLKMQGKCTKTGTLRNMSHLYTWDSGLSTRKSWAAILHFRKIQDTNSPSTVHPPDIPAMASYYSSLFSSTAHLQQTRALNKMLKSCTLVYICFWFSLKVHFLPAKKTEALAKPPGKPLQALQASFPHREVPSAPLGGSPQLPWGQRLFIVWASHCRDWRGQGRSERCVRL